MLVNGVQKGITTQADVTHEANLIALALLFKDEKIKLEVNPATGKITPRLGVHNVTYTPEEAALVTSATVTHLLNLRDQSKVSFSDQAQIKRLQDIYAYEVSAVHGLLVNDTNSPVLKLPHGLQGVDQQTYQTHVLLNAIDGLNDYPVYETNEQLAEHINEALPLLTAMADELYPRPVYDMMCRFKGALIRSGDRILDPSKENAINIPRHEGVSPDQAYNDLLDDLGTWLQKQDRLHAESRQTEKPNPTQAPTLD